MKKKKILKPSTYLIFIAVAIFVAVVPLVNQGYSMMILNLGLIYSIAAYGVSVMLGLGGQLSFAAVSFMGLGAYFTANLCSGRQGFWLDTSLTLVIVLLVAAVTAYLIGMVLNRLSGTYFTFATIGLVQVTWSFYLSYKPLFGGPDGISNICTLRIFGWSPANYNEWFYVLAFLVLIVALLVERIRRSQLGRSLSAIRDNEIAAQTLGINVYRTKVIAFTIAGVLAALSGALYAMHSQFVSSDMFTYERATTYIIMVMLGGVNNTFGVFVGSVLVTMLPEWLRGLQRYLQLIYGIGVILLMVFMPMGLAGLTSGFGKSLKRKIFPKDKITEREQTKR
ncbi:branched-chain amino acid ABC transporter permease [Caproiciproducens sp.]|uniref:branched-chain amino acid ABC transporter permease n=1 Tax=Caproiciproducens sp. TaxID=1954376 RepID=UPI002898C53B|nr:branched-chain amino acid ABC transporter permease [Caproiciproducens sp.]